MIVRTKKEELRKNFKNDEELLSIENQIADLRILKKTKKKNETELKQEKKALKKEKKYEGVQDLIIKIWALKEEIRTARILIRTLEGSYEKRVQ